MDLLIALLILALLAVPIATIVSIAMAIGTRDRLRALERRLVLLEQTPGGLPAASPAPPQPPKQRVTPEPSPAPAPIAAPPPDVQAPRPSAAEPPAAEPRASGPPAPAPSKPVPVHAPSPPVPPQKSFEERFGTQWVVWVGGIALALGGFFLVRLSIQQGLIGPGVRVTLGALLATAVIAAGEWARRSDQLSGIAGLPSAHIPSILTAAGTTIAYADVYAAYALYGFLAPAAAFLLLGAVALATLAAALLHGPALAGLGLVGAYVTPVLVASNRPDYWSLYIYLAVVTAAAFPLARLRMWRWLAITAIGFAFLWTFAGIVNGHVEALGAHTFHVVVGFALAAILIVSGLLYGPPAEPARIDAISSGALAAFLAASAILVLASRHDPLALAALVVLVTATCAIAWRSEAATAAVPAAAVLVAIVFAGWAVNTDIVHLIAPGGPAAGVVPEPERAQFGWHLVLGIGFGLLFAGTGFLAQGRSAHALAPVLWSAAAVFAPVAILVALYYRIAGFDRSIPFASVALLMAALAAYATELLSRRAARPGLAASGAIFATGAVAALALALTMALDKGWLTVALALMVPGIAWIALKRPLPALRSLAALIAALVLARIAHEPRIVGADVGTVPIFNWLLYGYGIPAAAFWLGGHWLRQRADDAPARMVDLAAILFTVLLAFLEIRHFMTGGDVYRHSAGLAELALHVWVWLALAIGLERLRLRTRSMVHDLGALASAALALAAIVFGLGFIDNPLATGEPVGGPFFNLILLGYGVPALLAGALAVVARPIRPRPYGVTAAITAVALALAYLTLQVTRFYHGADLTDGETGDAEQYTYSAVWLAFGVVLLAAGVWLRSRPVRFASAAVTFLTVLKVFFIDLSNLTGIYQALSFIGLGIVLLGTGRFYQRMLFRPIDRSGPAPQPGGGA
ncbi:MAG TPA: DUF2339 domain-containing protein [Xanthobacteraceae bacterium]